MKLIEKRTSPNSNSVYFYVLGIRVFSIKSKNKIINAGKNNVIELGEKSGIRVYVRGNNNRIVVKDTKYNPHFEIQILDCDNCDVFIDKDFSCGGGIIKICEDNTKITFGVDCMFSTGITMWASDTHTIIQDDKGVNIGKYITLGNHVWLGEGVTVLKNTIIADNCIVGTRAVVSGKFDISGCVIAGNPGHVIKQGVNWDRRCPKKYNREVLETRG